MHYSVSPPDEGGSLFHHRLIYNQASADFYKQLSYLSASLALISLHYIPLVFAFVWRHVLQTFDRFTARCSANNETDWSSIKLLNSVGPPLVMASVNTAPYVLSAVFYLRGNLRPENKKRWNPESALESYTQAISFKMGFYFLHLVNVWMMSWHRLYKLSQWYRG